MENIRTAYTGRLLAGSALASATALAAHAACAENNQHPNIIYINADDLGVMDVHFDGRKEYRTPNLDKLAAEGMVFTNAYAPAANCAPSRACCMSGQYTPRHGVYTVQSSARGLTSQRKLIPIKNTKTLRDDITTIPEALKAAGYKTIALGKWHLGKDPKTQGFDINIGGDHSGGPHGGYFTPFKSGPMKKYNDEYPKGTHRAAIFADKAVKFMRENKDKAFFMYMAYYSVHSPLKPVPALVDKYKDVENINPVYASMIENMDASVGKILDELDKLGLKKKTFVLFTSDNGGVRATSNQTPYRAGKGSYFDGGIRVPMCVRWPGHVKPETKCDTPVSGVDFFPTFLEVAGIKPPKEKILDGVSLLPLLTGTGTIPKRPLFWHFPIYLQISHGQQLDFHDKYFRTRPGSAIRFGKWKLHQYFEDGRIELYDLENDKGEKRDLAKEMPEKAKELLAILENWRKNIHAPLPTEKNPQYDPSKTEPDKKIKKNKKTKKTKKKKSKKTKKDPTADPEKTGTD